MSTNCVTKMQVRSIYKLLLRESKKISSYNIRNYAQRRIRDAFQENKSLTDPNKIDKEFQFAQQNLDIIRRQALIGHLYSSEKLVIETAK